MEEKEVEKKAYTAPKLTVLGDVEEITLGLQCGNAIDSFFPAHRTPFAQFTCGS
jgi:hypothetical protein